MEKTTINDKRVRDAALAHGYRTVRILEHTGSTNDDARAILTNPNPAVREELGELSVIATDDQRTGHGRLDRPWVTPPHTALAASVIVRPHAGLGQFLPPENYHWLTLIMGLSVREVLTELGVDCALKWPNDVIAGGKKCCGVLAQLILEPAGTNPAGTAETAMSMVVGAGINLNMRAQQLPTKTSTSAAIQLGHTVNTEGVLTRLLQVFARRYRAFCSVEADPQRAYAHEASLLDQAREHTITLGAQVAMHLPDGRIVTGTAEDLDAQGHILVRSDGSLTAYAVGDIEHLRAADGSYLATGKANPPTT